MRGLQERLKALQPARLHGMRRGVEKESLRVTPAGLLAMTPHPAALGSALTHERITTDFSEAQLELITGVHASAETEMTAARISLTRCIPSPVVRLRGDWRHSTRQSSRSRDEPSRRR